MEIFQILFWNYSELAIFEEVIWDKFINTVSWNRK